LKQEFQRYMADSCTIATFTQMGEGEVNAAHPSLSWIIIPISYQLVRDRTLTTFGFCGLTPFKLT
jgi:hypothetical protein